MAELGATFDANTVEPSQPRVALPDNDYSVVIEASEWKETKSKDGQYYLELTLQVTDGPFKGRKLWDRLNLTNKNVQAVEIAQRTLSAICHATGVMQVKDSSQLHNIPMLAKVKATDAENNEIKGYKKLGVVVGGVPAAAAPAPASAPWMKKPAA